MSSTIRELPGYVSVKGAGERLRLAPRSVRDLIYAGRLPSARLGRRHYIRLSDVDAERRRRLGLPLPVRHPRARRVSRPLPRPRLTVVPSDLSFEAVPASTAPSVAVTPRHRPLDSSARRQRSLERAALFERWLRSGRRPAEPHLPVAVQVTATPFACEACGRPVRAGTRAVSAEAVDGRPAARLCLACARRALLEWADERRREATAARTLARDLGGAPTVPAVQVA